ncbi:MAG: hypothetical protein U1E17_25305 [Geminicoccaceae bacterium]
MSAAPLPEIPAPDTAAWAALVARAEPEVREIIRQLSTTLAEGMQMLERMHETNRLLVAENDRLRLAVSSVAGSA